MEISCPTVHPIISLQMERSYHIRTGVEKSCTTDSRNLQKSVILDSVVIGPVQM